MHRTPTHIAAFLSIMLGSLVAGSARGDAPADATPEADIPDGCMLIDDIIVPRDFFTNRATYGAATNPWDFHVVHYVFDSNVTVINQNRMLAAMGEIEAVCNIKFIEGAHAAGYIQVKNSSGNNSFVGKSGSAQVVNIASWSFRFIIVHELLHALGMWHEQQRPDRDTYVSINTENIQAGTLSNFSKIPSASTFGTYDFESLMHYDACSFSTCCPAGSTCSCPSGCESITALPPYQAFQSIMGQRSYISEGDIDWLVYVYGEPDCNGNGINDVDDVLSGFSTDCNANGVPDECDIASGVPTYSDEFYGFTSYDDCNGNSVLDACDFDAGTSFDCNANNVPDECDIASGTSQDVNNDGEPDECTPAPGAFTIITPTNGSTDVPTGPALDWTDALDADDYLVQFNTSPTFTTPAYSAAVTDSQLTLPPGTLSAYTTYFWRVTARNVGGSVLSSPSLLALTTGAPAFVCEGDINADDSTDVFDFAIFASNFGRTDLSPGDGPDLDGDGDADVFDFAIFAADFGCPAN